MYRAARSVSTRSLRHVQTRSYSSNGPPKKAFPMKELLIGTTVLQYGGLGYIVYKCEADKEFEAYMTTIPGAMLLVDPVRAAMRWAGMLRSLEEAPKEDLRSLMETVEEVSEPVAVIQSADEEEGEAEGVALSEALSEALVGEVEAQGGVQGEEVGVEAGKGSDDAEAPPEPMPTLSVQEPTDSQSLLVTSRSLALAEVPAEDLAKATESSVLREALADSAREYIALRRDLEATMLKDLNSLDEAQLRGRVRQISSEMFERLAWADLRTAQGLQGVQSELTQKFTALLNQQRAELELQARQAIFAYEQEMASSGSARMKAQDAAYQAQLTATIRAQAEGFQATLQRELESQNLKITQELQDQLNHEVAVMRKTQLDELLALQPAVQAATESVTAVSDAVAQAGAEMGKTVDVLALSAAVLSLELALNDPSGAPVSGLFVAVRQASASDAVVGAVLDSLPSRVLSEGALPLPALQVRFAVMREEARKAALAPEGAPKIVGQLIGTVLATISWKPSGFIAGPGAEESLARAAFFLERGKLSQSLKELEGVKGYSQVLMGDWVQLARERLIVDQSIKALKANAVIRHKCFN
ncbi:mitochondrial inner membrane protein-domain-containing protein [Ochromonadaceae sp. CCMP2298]|nr:mitochondrial inner membrane protein-domain-containing protein [Ochromonadaceae sp. CCMP2298]